MFSVFEIFLKRVENELPSFSKFEALLKAVEGSDIRFTQAIEAIKTSFRVSISQLQEIAKNSPEDESSFYTRTIGYRQSVLEGIERGETTHFISFSGNGVTIPGSSKLNTEAVRWSWAEELCEV